MKIKFKIKRTGETFVSKSFASETEAWNYYWKLRANKSYFGFETVGF